MSKGFRVGKWLPTDQKAMNEWLDQLISEVKVNRKDQLEKLYKMHPVVKNEEDAITEITTLDVSTREAKELGFHESVQNLMEAILTDPEINMFFHQMFWQQYQNSQANQGIKIPCWQLAIVMIDLILTTAPKYSRKALVGFPINAILNWPMATTAGFAAFLNDKVNRLFKQILDEWGMFLTSKNSQYVLNDDPRNGWFGEDAMEDMPNFSEEFICDPAAPYYGYGSWDDFFVREYREGVRPVAAPSDNSVVANACESAPFKLSSNVRRRDYFWVKAQRYSLEHILNNNHAKVEKFIGGTVYQAFLSALSYHRWHSPVSGTIVGKEIVEGSYYSQSYVFQDDYAAPNFSQGYLSQVAARGIVYIEADNPDIGLMAFVSIGMSEVSTNEITVRLGQHVKKGEQLGMFHFGGSTHLLIFGPQVNIEFHLGDNQPGLDANNIPVRSKLATVGPKKEK